MSTLRNKVNLIGRIGQHPEVQTVKNGHMFTRFSVATHELYKDKDGEWKDKTQWHNAILWGKSAERFVRTVTKGSEVAIEGKLVNNKYESREGEKRHFTQVEVSDFLLLTTKAPQEQA